MRKIVMLACALMLSACSTNYGFYEKGTERHGEFGYISTYLAIAAGVLLVGSLDDDDDNGSGSGSGGGGLY